MVEGVEVKIPSFFWPITIFFMFLALMNPLVVLECEGEHCRTFYVSEYDGDNYTDWVANGTWLQATGNLTFWKLTHGLVNCENKCDDCAEDDCVDWDYGDMKELDNALQSHGASLPDFLTTMCYCADYCEGNCENGLIALPGNNTANSKWINMDCNAMEASVDAVSGKICGLVDLYTWAHIVTIVCLVFMAFLQLVMLGLEYVNFDSFLDGRCRCLFCPYRVKKSLYIVLACICLTAQVFTFFIVNRDTEDKLNDYFEVIDGSFTYNWNTRGYYLYLVAIILSGVTILTMVFMKEVQRQKKKSYRNDIHGISTESVLARKF